MRIDVSLAPVEEILTLRDLHRQEMNCQIIHDSWHARRWTDTYLLQLDGRVVGYGSVGAVRGKRKDLIMEFYVLPIHRGSALPLFRKLIEASKPKRVEAQTNDILLTLMLYDCARRIRSESVLFHDGFTTTHSLPDAVFRPASELDGEWAEAGEWVIESNLRVVAKGGVLFHYNVPYGDIYMEVADSHRRHGYGSFLVQELKRTCYEMGRIPAARCNVSNEASRAALQKAGFMPCARMLVGLLAT